MPHLPGFLEAAAACLLTIRFLPPNMLSRLTSVLGGIRATKHPSVVLVTGQYSTDTLHMVPESNVAESFSYGRPATSTFSFGGATERLREQIGSITLHVGDGEGWNDFLDDVGNRATLLLSKEEPSVLEAEVTRALDQASRSAVLDALEERARSQSSENAT